MPFFQINPCASEEPSFFTSGNYGASSFSVGWSTRSPSLGGAPDTDGLNTPVYLLVLDKFNIPASFPNGQPSGGTLPGIDIKRMDAIQAIRLSLAESLLQNEWWDVLEDGSGGVIFQLVFDGAGPGRFIDLDVRLCVPSAEKTNEVDMVIVRGYDPPPLRDVRTFRDVVPAGLGTINPESVTGEEDLFTVAPAELIGGSCFARLAEHSVWKSYKDPVFQDTFNPQEPNPFYSVKRFEDVLSYIHRITGLPSNPDDAARIQYEIQTTTTWYRPTVFPPYQRVSVPRCVGAESGGNISYFEGSFIYQSPDFNDRYGTPWPLVIQPAGLYFSGHSLDQLVDFGTFGTPIAFVNPIKELKSLDQSNYLWDIIDRGRFEITLYFQPQEGDLSQASFRDDTIFDSILALQGQQVQIRYSDGATYAPGGDYPSGQGILNVIANTGGLGYLLEGMWLALLLDRPALQVTDTDGGALEFAENIRIEYAPIILTDEPAPIAYFHVDEGGHVVDQTTGREDTDPTTCQNFEESELEHMQDLVQGNALDINLPFSGTGEDCLRIAEMVFNYMRHEQVQTYVLTCSPDSEPELGAGVNGFPTDLVIQNINYSYSDASSYNIEVTLGPVFNSIGSWNNSSWIRKTENVNRDAIIRWVAGDGVNYRVEVKGLGTYNAVNGTDKVFYPGEIVQVTIYNVPIEE